MALERKKMRRETYDILFRRSATKNCVRKKILFNPLNVSVALI